MVESVRPTDMSDSLIRYVTYLTLEQISSLQKMPVLFPRSSLSPQLS